MFVARLKALKSACSVTCDGPNPRISQLKDNNSFVTSIIVT